MYPVVCCSCESVVCFKIYFLDVRLMLDKCTQFLSCYWYESILCFKLFFLNLF